MIVVYYRWVSVGNSSLYVDSEYVGYAVGKISTDFHSDGDVSLYMKAYDCCHGPADEQLLVDAAAEWRSLDAWSSSGTIESVTTIEDNMADWNRLYSLTAQFDDGAYGFDSGLYDNADTQYTGATASGTYGGRTESWYATLDESSLIWDQTAIGSSLAAVSGSFAESGDVTFHMTSADASAVQTCLVDSEVAWSTPGSWYSAGGVSADTTVVTGDFHRTFDLDFLYEENTFDGEATVVDGEGVVWERLAGTGRYGGSSASDWWGVLDDGVLVYEQDLIGSAAGELRTDIETSGNLGNVYFHLTSADASAVQTCLVDSEVAWSTPGSWYSAGDVSADTTVVTGDFHRTFDLDFLYEENTFDGEATVVDGEGVVWERLAGTGRYGGSSASDWWGVLDDGVLVYEQDLIGSAAGELRTDIETSGNLGNVYFYGTTSPEATVSESDAYYTTTNNIAWEFSSDRVYGLVFTDTSVEERPQFLLKSYADVDLEDEEAKVFFVSSSEGVENVNYTATAFYSVATGFLTGIDMVLYYEENLIFYSDIFLNAMTSSLDSPPPSAEPSVKPSARPSAAPSRRPSAKPTSTKAPTRAPTGTSGTYIEFALAIVMEGVDPSEFSGDEAAQKAASLTTRDALNPEINLDGVTLVSARRRGLRAAGPSGGGGRHLVQGSTTASYTVKANINNLGYSSPESAYSNLVSNLDASIATGIYEAALVTNGDAEDTDSLANSSVSQAPVVSNYTSYDEGQDSSSDSNSIDTGILVGIIVAGVVVMAILAYGYWYWVYVGRGRVPTAKTILSDPAQDINDTSDVITSENPMAKQQQVCIVSVLCDLLLLFRCLFVLNYC
jgi:hypothetical protein